MNIYTLDESILDGGEELDFARAADMICFCPHADYLISARALWREALLDALRKNKPITAVISFEGSGLNAGSDERERDALREMLSLVTFLFVVRPSAELILSGSMPHLDRELPADPDEAMLLKLYCRFGLDSAVLTDASLAFDGERFSPFIN